MSVQLPSPNPRFMLKSITIENYRSCLRTSVDLHPNLSVLIGPNGSGKTNILQAILLLNKMRDQEPRSRTNASGVSCRIRAVFRRGKAEARMRAFIDTFTDESNVDKVIASRQKWRLKSQDGERAVFEMPMAIANMLGDRHLHRSGSYFYHDVRFSLRMGDKVIPKWARQLVVDIDRYCTGIRYYGASQFTNPGSCPSSFQIEEESGRLRLSRLRGHAKILYSMYRAQKEGRNRKYQQFLDVVGPRGLRLIDDLIFREVPTSSVDYSVRVGGRVEARKRKELLVVPQFKVGRQKLSPNQLSEGTFKTLSLLFHVITDNATVLLVEEPEVCVHHGLLSSILELIKSASRRKQMILSTHSDYVLDHVKPENVYRVTFNKPVGTVARHISKALTTKEYAALRSYLATEGNLGEYWREGGLGDRP